MTRPVDEFKPGQRVVVTQQIPQRDEVWTTRLEGTVVKAHQAKTGSWFAHAKDDKLWLDRLTVRKDDGEIVECNLDRFSHIELIEPEASEEAAADEGEGEPGEAEGEAAEPSDEGKAEA